MPARVACPTVGWVARWSGIGRGTSCHADGDLGIAKPRRLTPTCAKGEDLTTMRSALCSAVGLPTVDPQGQRHRAATLHRILRFFAEVPLTEHSTVMAAFRRTGVLRHSSFEGAPILAPMGDPFTLEACHAAQHGEQERRESYDLLLAAREAGGGTVLRLNATPSTTHRPTPQCQHNPVRPPSANTTLCDPPVPTQPCAWPQLPPQTQP